MLQLSLVVFAAAAASLGWHWAGFTEGRTSWVATGLSALVLTGVTVFSSAGGHPLPEWGFTATAAVFFALLAIRASWGIVTDSTLGFYALFFAGAAGLSTAGYSNRVGEFDIASLAMTVATAAGALVAVSGLLSPPSAAFRRAVGCFLGGSGLAILLLVYLPTIGVDF